ncbi:MAG: YggU family protein [Proteobacteria bacterium]|nr:YggU family protein [Pseudomonadota bacterium]
MIILKINERKDGVTIECRVSPRAGRSRVKGMRDGVLQVALAAPPVEGAANDEIIELLSKELGVPRSRISILRGARSRTKVVLIQGVDKSALSKLTFQS